MSPEVLSQLAAGTALAAGAVADARAMHNAEKNAKLVQLEAATQGINESQKNAVEPGRAVRVRRWLGRHATAPLALLAAGAIGMGVYSLERQPETVTPPSQPKVESVFDKSGATNLSLDGKPTALQVSALANDLASRNIRGEAWVAGNGTVSVPRRAGTESG